MDKRWLNSSCATSAGDVQRSGSIVDAHEKKRCCRVFEINNVVGRWLVEATERLEPGFEVGSVIAAHRNMHPIAEKRQ